ncbi:MAG: VPLPA-CTERM-specific exosortase XrtD [Mangrovicoccus sp.]
MTLLNLKNIRIEQGFFWLMALVVASVPLFWMGIEAFISAWSTAEYSHGPLIPIISLYLFLREMRAEGPAIDPSPNRWPGVFVLAGALMLAVLGNMVNIPDIVCYSMIVWTFGIVLICYGWDRGRRHWAPVLHLIFMLPLPQFIYWKLSIFLQLVSTDIGVWLTQLVRIPVFQDGNIIDLGIYKLQVAEACSGLRYLFPILSFSYLFSILYKGPMLHKAILLLSAAPITVLMNSFRIAMIAVLVNFYGIEAADGFLHYFEGWVIFLSCVGILFLMSIALQRMTRDPLPLSEAIDFDTDGMGRELTRVFEIKRTPALIAGLGLAIAISSSYFSIPKKELIFPERTTFLLFPRELGDYSGTFFALSPEIEDTLGADDYVSGVYSSQAGDSVDLFVAYYENQADGTGIHSPEVCLPNSGWEVFSLEPHEIDMSDRGYGVFNVNRAVIQKGFQKQLVYYWFEQRGARFTGDIGTKLSVLQGSLITGRMDGALIRFVTPFTEATEAEAEKRIQDFMKLALGRMPEFVPF